MADSVYQAWLNTVARNPRKILLTDAGSGTSWSAAAIQAAVEALDREIPGRKSWARRVVLIHLPNSFDWLTAFLLCQKRHSIALSLDTDTSPERIPALREQLRVAACRTLAGFEHFPARPSYRLPACLIKLTSGATGTPKPLFFTDSEMRADARQVGASMGLSTDDSNYAAIPFGHSYGLGNLVFPLILEGIPSVLARDIFPAGIALDFERTRPTFFPAVPTLLRALAQSEVSPESFRSLRRVISAGSFLPPAVARLFRDKLGITPRNFYGSSETGGIAFDRTGEATLTGRSVGSPLEGVRVVTTPTRRLKIISPAVHTCYNRLRADGMGAQVLADFGEILGNGEIRLTGRRRTLLKVAGRRLNPMELENAVLARPDVDHAFVDTYPAGGGESHIALVYEGDAGPDDLRSHLRNSFPRWKTPRKIIRHPFPLTHRGKVRVDALKGIVQRATSGKATPGG